MPTLDRRLLAWSDSDTDDDDDRLMLPTTTNRRGLGASSSYDRTCAAAASVDDVLVPAGAYDDGRRAGTSPSWSGTRKAFVAAGLVAGGCLRAYLAWRYCGSTGTLPVSS